MNVIKHIPNSLTCLNLICGMAGIYFVLEDHIFFGAYFIFAAAVFDFFDGFVARLLKANSGIGKQLDSLADLVTFGVLPAFIVFKMLQNIDPGSYLPFLAFLIGVQSALRLAKFNIDTRQADRFIGVPTPANALLISTLPFLAEQFHWTEALIYNQYFLLIFSLLFAWLLTVELPLIALKFKNFSIKDNIYRYLTLIIAIICLLTMGIAGIPFAIISYVGLSIIETQRDSHARNQ
ncbi:MAG: CDP-diacylglycerol--serine O-phosphatidyltransferase [Anditalea sp.]